MNGNSHNEYLSVFIPNVRKPIPLFVVFRALGFESDREIINIILGEKLKNNEIFLELLKPSITDSGGIYSQDQAISFIQTFIKEMKRDAVYFILSDYFLPHLGEMTFKTKAYYLGHMVLQLLKTILGLRPVTDRDHYKYKRVETSGHLMKELFSEYANIMYKEFFVNIEREYYFNKSTYDDSDDFNNILLQQRIEDAYVPIQNTNGIYPKIIDIIRMNEVKLFGNKVINDGFRKAFKGNWGAFSHTKRIGVIQELNRLSYNSFLSHLRKVNLNIDASAKITGPHMLHGTQWGIIDPVDTPDGGNVGFHKHMAMLTKVSHKMDANALLNWVNENTNITLKLNDTVVNMKFINIINASNNFLQKYAKVFINGSLVGVTNLPILFKKTIIQARRKNTIPIYVSVTHEIEDNCVQIWCDEGRLLRPLLYLREGKTIYEHNKALKDRLEENTLSWEQMIYPPTISKTGSFNEGFLPFSEFSDDVKNMSLLEYLDKSEEENMMIVASPEYNRGNLDDYTHKEIHPSLLLGVMGNQIILPEHNQLPRDLFSCGQSKQAVSLYHSNYHNRIDKMGVVLNYGEIPIVKSRYLDYINESKHPYGQNTIVAIMCHSGYNVEDSILFNKGSVERGMFLTTYYNSYQTREEDGNKENTSQQTVIKNIINDNVISTKPGYDYNYLDSNGLIRKDTPMDDKKVVIGRLSYNISNPEEKYDSSVFPKKGQLGYVDKVYLSTGEEGGRLAKIRVREQRVPAIGDKFCSRCGQKGTIGALFQKKTCLLQRMD